MFRINCAAANVQVGAESGGSYSTSAKLLVLRKACAEAGI